MKVWLAGATGFLGAHVYRQLVDRGDEVVAVSRGGGLIARSPEPGAAPDAGETLPVGVCDVLDSAAVHASAQGCELALLCTGMVSRDPSDAALLHKLHVSGTRTALAGLQLAGVRRTVVASTSGTIAVSQDSSRIDDELSGEPMELIAAWPYYRTKYFGEQEALAAAESGQDVVVVNPSLLLGPGDLRESSTADVRRFLEKAFLSTPSGGIAFVDARDAAAGLLLAAAKGKSGERYLLNAANMTFSAFFGRLARQTGIAAPLMKLPKNQNLARGIFNLYERSLKAIGGDAPVTEEEMVLASHYWYCDSTKAEAELGFAPRDPGDTLRDTVEDLRLRHIVAPREMR